MPFTVEEIGKRAKERNPELGKFSDTEIGDRLVKRNPNLSSLVAPKQEAPQAPAPHRGIMDIASDVVVGAGKGIGSTISGLESLGEKLITRPIDKAVSFITGKKGPLPTEGPTEGERIQEKYLQPTNTAQKVGRGAEQLAEMLLPIPGGAKAKAATKLAGGVKGILGRGALEAGEMGLKTAVQTGGDVKETAQSALLGGAFGVGGGLLSKGASEVAPKLVESAERSMTQALGPTTKATKKQAEKVVPELLKRGFRGTSRADLASKAGANLEKATESLEEVISKIPPGKKIAARPILTALSEAKKSHKVGKVVVDQKGLKAIKDLEKTVKQFGPHISFESLRKLRQVWDKAVAKSKGFLMDEVTSASVAAKREGSNAIRAELAKRFPDLAKVNAEYSFWRNVDDILQETMTRTAGQSKPLGEQILAGAGAAGGLAAHGITGAITGAVVMSNLRKAMTSAAWRTTSATIKNKIADALAHNQLEDALSLIAKIIGTATTER